MIDEIHVENLALIRNATLAPCAGLTVLTGETGAGKTALLSACKLLIGERASAQMVRDGEESLSVSGRFFVKAAAGDANGEGDAENVANGGEGAVGWPDSGGSAPDAASACERDVVVTRRVGSDGRSRVTIDGRMASASQLAATIGPVVDLCGQHEHQRLPERGFSPLRFPGVDVQMRHDAVKQKQERDADEKADRRGNERKAPVRHLDRGDQKRPDRRGDHHARREAEQELLHGGAHPAFCEKDAARAERRPRQGKRDPQQYQCKIAQVVSPSVWDESPPIVPAIR